jgi:2-polyprenyl-3-methyl-5-hydroxy-6-metoxy-1,4-benzoquinol methylase
MEETENKAVDFDNKKSKGYNLYVASSDIKHNLYLYTQQQLAADVNGKNILDVGCGDGQAYRKFLELGAFEATACDISEPMINECKKTDKQLGIQEKVHYLITDAKDGNLIERGPFDLVICNFVLNLIESEESLKKVLQTLFINCTEKGKVLAISTIGALPEGKREYIEKACGAKHSLLPEEGLPNFTPNKVTFFPGIEVTCYYNPVDFIIDLFYQVGFNQVESKPWIKNPNYSGNIDLNQFILNDSAYIIEAKK